MSDLTVFEKRNLESLFGMGSGYVLNFNNRTFQEFVIDSSGIDIESNKYGTGSKANRLRAFWKEEPNQIVGKLITALLEYYSQLNSDGFDSKIYQECERIAVRLTQASLSLKIEAFASNSAGNEFQLLEKSVRDCIDKNDPQSGLDRLHTFTVKYIRELCERHGLKVEKDVALNGLIGKYVKYLREKDLIESTMTERILKSSIAIMESFNDVRNNRSLAHPNPILNFNESMLIFSNVTTCIKFIDKLEAQIKGKKPDADSYDIPF